MKTTTLNFKEKVQAMTGKEIIMVMVDSIQNPVIMLDMNDFGDAKDGVCYGCAATNSICKISGKTFDEDSIDTTSTRAKFIGTGYDFLHDFEFAIDGLRQGQVKYYNGLAKEIGIATINQNGIQLPFLTNDFTPEDLQAYINLANAQN